MIDQQKFSPHQTLVLHNPVSGRGESRRRAVAVVQQLRHRGYHIRQTQPTEKLVRDEIGQWDDRWESVICLGGDGTLYQVIAQIPPSLPIAFYPTGTVNLLALSLSIPKSIDDWLQLLQRQTTRDIYLGQANGRPFVSVGSVGFDARVVARVSPWLKHWLHEAAYGLQALWELPQYRISQYRVTVDERDIGEHIIGIIIGKGAYFAGPYPIFNDMKHDTPKLSVVVLHGEHKRQILSYAYALVRGSLLDTDGMATYSANQVVVEATEESDVELDGEPFGLTPVTFSVESLPRKFLVP